MSDGMMGAPARLVGLGTAVPPHEMAQGEVARRAEKILGPRFPDFGRLSKTFTTSGVEKRYAVCPLDWYEEEQDWPGRAKAYLNGAKALFKSAAYESLEDAGWRAEEVDTVVTISSTGVATPTLEAQVFGEMGFRRDVHRVPVFGLGCAGGVSGLSIAQRLAISAPGSKVLLVCVEACSVSFRQDRLRKADIIATVLFGDGAAAACLSTSSDLGPLLGAGVEHIWPDSLNIMGWDVGEAGLGVIFDRSIPPFVEEEFAKATDFCLSRMNLARSDIKRFICHPGGRKVLEAIEGTMGFEPGALDHERAVLRDYGNMSAPTVLFVLKRVMAANPSGQMLMTGLGPGFTASMLPIAFEGDEA